MLNADAPGAAVSLTVDLHLTTAEDHVVLDAATAKNRARVVEGVALRNASEVDRAFGALEAEGATRLDEMGRIVAGLVGIDAARVSVKAATGNLSGDEGAGRTISASALVSVVSR